MLNKKHMKKIFYITGLCLFTLSAHAQIPGSKIKGPIEVQGTKVDEGDTLHIGTGSNPNGNFKFIVIPINVLAGVPETPLHKQFANTHIVVKFLKKYESKRVGEKYFAVINPGGFNHMVDLQPAIEAGELLGVNQHRFMKETAQNKPVSTADELLKYKQLLDAGAITQEEYDKQKKKLLGN